MPAMGFTPDETVALKALVDGELRPVDGAWWIVTPDHARAVSPRLVRGLRGEGLLERGPYGTLRLTARGRELAQHAADELLRRGRADEETARALLARGPLLLLPPAADSDEVDYLLVASVDPPEASALRRRRAEALRAARDDGFAFAQYATEIAAIPIGSAAARLGWLPDAAAEPRVVPGRLDPEAVHALGARGCPDRGVNLSGAWVQWFGGFGPADPLVTTARLPHARVEELCARAEALGAGAGPPATHGVDGG